MWLETIGIEKKNPYEKHHKNDMYKLIYVIQNEFGNLLFFQDSNDQLHRLHMKNKLCCTFNTLI